MKDGQNVDSQVRVLNRAKDLVANDFAMVRIPPNCKVPEWMKPLPIISSIQELSNNYLSAHLNGWGRIGSNQSYSQYSRSIKVSIQNVNTDYLPDLIEVNLGTEAAHCKGDSGSSLILANQNGEEAIAGNAFGATGCYDDAEHITQYTNILNAVSWIEETTKQKLSRWNLQKASHQISQNKTCFDIYSFYHRFDFYKFPSLDSTKHIMKLEGQKTFLKNSRLLVISGSEQNGFIPGHFLMIFDPQNEKERHFFSFNQIWFRKEDIHLRKSSHCIPYQTHSPW